MLASLYMAGSFLFSGLLKRTTITVAMNTLVHLLGREEEIAVEGNEK